MIKVCLDLRLDDPLTSIIKLHPNCFFKININPLDDASGVYDWRFDTLQDENELFQQKWFACDYQNHHHMVLYFKNNFQTKFNKFKRKLQKLSPTNNTNRIYAIGEDAEFFGYRTLSYVSSDRYDLNRLKPPPRLDSFEEVNQVDEGVSELPTTCKWILVDCDNKSFYFNTLFDHQRCNLFIKRNLQLYNLIEIPKVTGSLFNIKILLEFLECCGNKYTRLLNIFHKSTQNMSDNTLKKINIDTTGMSKEQVEQLNHLLKTGWIPLETSTESFISFVKFQTYSDMVKLQLQFGAHISIGADNIE